MRMPGRMAGRVVVVLAVWAIGEGAGAEPSAEQLAAHCRAALTAAAASPQGELQQQIAALQPFVLLQPSQITAQGEVLSWRCLPARKLLPEEEDRVWDALESILRTLLSRVPQAGSDRPPLTEAEAERVVRGGDLGFLPQPAWRDVPPEKIRETILRYVESVRARPESDPQFARLLGAIPLDPEKLSIHGTRIAWTVAPSPKLLAAAKQIQDQLARGTNGFSRPNPQVEAAAAAVRRATREFEAAVESTEPLLRRGVIAALAAMPAGESGVPLVSVADAAAATVDVVAETWELEVHTGINEAAMAMMELRATASKGSPQRTLTQLRRLALTPEPLDSMPLLVAEPAGAAPAEPDPPQLVVDTGGFAGGNVTAVAFSPDGRLLAAGGDVVRIWNLADGTLLHTLRGQRKLSGVGSCTDLAFSRDGRRLYVAAAGFSSSVRVYDLADPAQPIKVVGSHEGHVDRMALSPDGRLLITVGVDSRLHVCDLATDSVVARVELPELVDYLSFPSGGTWALLIDVKGQYALLDFIHHGQTETTSSARIERRGGAGSRANRRVGSETQPTERVGSETQPTERGGSETQPTERGGAGSQAAEAAVAKGEAFLLQWVGAAAKWARGGGPHGFALAADLARGQIAAGGLDRGSGSVHYWCAVWSGGKPQPDQVHKHGYYVTACALSADGQWVASADAMGEIHVWNAATGEQRHQLGAKSAAMYAVAFEAREPQAGSEAQPAGSRLLVGRTPLKPGAGWNYNHYSLLTHEFDLHDRAFRAIEPREPPAPLLEHEGRQLSIARDPGGFATLTVAKGGQEESRLPFAGAAGHLPLAYTFLTGDALGEPSALAVAGENGAVTLFEPTQFRSRQTLVGHSDRVWCLAQSADGRLLASGSGDGTIRIWKLAPPRAWGHLAAYADDDGRLYHVIPGTPTAAKGLHAGDLIQTIDFRSLGDLTEELLRTGKWPFRPLDKAQVVYERNKSVYTEEVNLSDMGDFAEPLFSLYVTPDGSDWVAWTPQGYYDASQDGDRLIGWHVNRGEDRAADFYRAEQFRNQFYRPDVIGQLLRSADLSETLRLTNAQRSRPAAELDVRRDAEGLLPPRVRIVDPCYALRTGRPRLTVTAEISSATELPLRDARVLVNGKAYTVKDVLRESAAATSIERVSDRQWVVRQEVQLAPGANDLAVIASTDLATSAPVSVRVTYRPDAAADLPPRLFVVAVGVAQYADARFALQFADRDAREFAEVWKTQEGGLYREVQSRVLLNAEATKPAVLDAMQWLIDSADEGDVAVLFLSGHGVCDENQNYYLATHEIAPDRLRSTTLSWREVLGTVYDLRCRRLLMFVDTCHGGGVAGTAPIVVDQVRDLAKSDVGAVLFASCSPQAKSLEHPDWQHGAFTEALLETFASSESDLASPPDGFLSITDLAHNLDSRVRKLTDSRQIPVVGIPPTLPSFDVYRLP